MTPCVWASDHSYTPKTGTAGFSETLHNVTATAVFTDRRENLKSQSVVLIKLNHVLGDTHDFPKS